MAQKELVIFQQSGETKTTIKNEPEKVFQFRFQFWEAKRQLFNIFFRFCSALSRTCRKHWSNA